MRSLPAPNETTDLSPSAGQEPDLRDYLRPLAVRWWLILGLVVAAAVGTYVYYDRQAPSYSASTRIFISTGQDNETTGFVPPPTDRTLQNQATLLTTDAVALKVAQDLGLPRQAVGGVGAVPSEGSDFITIAASNQDPRRAADIANAYARAFVDIRTQARRDRLAKALAEQRQQLRTLEPTSANAQARADAQTALAQIRSALATPTGEAQQLDPAAPPATPDSPRPVRSAVFAALLALIAGVILAYGLERFNRRLKRIEDVEAAYGLPLLVVLPHSRSVAAVVDGNAALGDDFREAFRQLRTNLQLEGLSRPIRRILVTSAVPGEGKSTVTRNLAIAYREFGVRVAVIDADLRRPSMGALFASEGRDGLTSVMAGEIGLRDAMQTVSIHAKGLATLARIQEVSAGARHASPAGASSSAVAEVATIDLLNAGPPPPNPQAVLSTQRMTQIIDRLSDVHDIVLIDSPPVTAVSDALALAGQVDAVLVVSRLEVTPRDAAQRSVGLLRRVPGVNLVGVVANDITGSEASRYSGYDSPGYGS